MKLVKLGEIADFINGRAFKPNEWGDEGIPIIRIQNLNDHTKPFNYFKGKYSENNSINDGDVLLSWSGTPGTSFGCFLWNRGKGVLNQHIFKVRVDKSICDKLYFIIAVNKNLDLLIDQAHGGVGLQHITKSKLIDIQIPLPALDAQKKIAAILDAADAYRQKTKTLIDKYDQLAQSLFLDMFGDLTTNSKTWGEFILGDVLELITYGLTVRPSYVELGIPLISAREIRTGKVDLESAPKISFEDFEKLTEKGKPKRNDILFSKTGSIGHCATVNTDRLFAVTQNAARLTFKETINTHYATHYLRSSFIQDLSQKRAKGNAVKDLQLGDMKKFKFLNPPIALQNQFAERIQLIEAQKQQAQASLQKAEDLFNSLLQRAFKGELVG